MAPPSAPGPAPEDLLPVVEATLVEQAMVVPGDSVVVGVSGGPDSVALLDLLFRLRKEWRIDLHVAHLNHQLRGKASDGDAAFVTRLAERLGLPCHSGSANVEALARPCKRSLEEAARLARHRFLECIRHKTGAARIALGHTRSDQAETLLLRLFRGAGRTGLGAIRPVREGIWVRPLLNVSRPEIEAYVAFRNLKARQDKSNSDPRFLRNRIRLELLPHLESAYAPGIEAILARTAEILRQEDDLLEQQTETALQKAVQYCGERKIILDVKAFFGYHISLQRRMIRRALIGFQAGPDAVSFRAVQRILNLLPRRSGAVQISPDLSAQRAGCRLILSRPTPPFQLRVRVPGRTKIPLLGATLETRVRPVEEVRHRLQRLGPDRACFDLSELGGELVVRNRRPGDRFQPYGLPGTRKVSDLLIDRKIPCSLRDEVPLLTGGGKIHWVVGLRTAQPVSVTLRTRSVLEVVFRGGWIGLAGP